MTIDMYVAVDNGGNWYARGYEADAVAAYLEECNLDGALRVVRLSLTLAEPSVLHLSGTIPERAGTEIIQLKVVHD